MLLKAEDPGDINVIDFSVIKNFGKHPVKCL